MICDQLIEFDVLRILLTNLGGEVGDLKIMCRCDNHHASAKRLGCRLLRRFWPYFLTRTQDNSTYWHLVRSNSVLFHSSVECITKLLFILIVRTKQSFSDCWLLSLVPSWLKYISYRNGSDNCFQSGCWGTPSPRS